MVCMACHDADGKGKIVKLAMPTIPDLTDPKWQSTRTDAELTHSILEGKESHGRTGSRSPSCSSMKDKLALGSHRREGHGRLHAGVQGWQAGGLGHPGRDAGAGRRDCRPGLRHVKPHADPCSHLARTMRPLPSRPATTAPKPAAPGSQPVNVAGNGTHKRPARAEPSPGPAVATRATRPAPSDCAVSSQRPHRCRRRFGRHGEHGRAGGADSRGGYTLQHALHRLPRAGWTGNRRAAGHASHPRLHLARLAHDQEQQPALHQHPRRQGDLDAPLEHQGDRRPGQKTWSMYVRNFGPPDLLVAEAGAGRRAVHWPSSTSRCGRSDSSSTTSRSSCRPCRPHNPAEATVDSMTSRPSEMSSRRRLSASCKTSPGRHRSRELLSGRAGVSGPGFPLRLA